jgi:hypothetical protein
MVLAAAAGVVLAFALTIWLAYVPSSGPGANARRLLEARERREVLGGQGGDAELERVAAELEGTLLRAAPRPAPPSPAVSPAAPAESAERRS